MSTRTAPVRHAARVVLLDERNRVLLLRYDERGQRFWALPGGTLEPGESHEQAAARELHEELGIADTAIGPQIASRDTGEASERRVVECYFSSRVRSTEVEAGNPTQPDQIRGHRWWTLDDLHMAEEAIYPGELADLVHQLIKFGVPGEPVTLS